MRLSLACIALLGACFLQTSSAVKIPSAHTQAVVNYHIWYHPEPNDANAVIKNQEVEIEENATFGSVMEKAMASNNEFFNFEFIQYPFGRQITSIGGYKEDSSKDIYWMLYLMQDEIVDPSSPPKKENLAEYGIDGQMVKNGETYLFWRQVHAPE